MQRVALLPECGRVGRRAKASMRPVLALASDNSVAESGLKRVVIPFADALRSSNLVHELLDLDQRFREPIARIALAAVGGHHLHALEQGVDPGIPLESGIPAPAGREMPLLDQRPCCVPEHLARTLAARAPERERLAFPAAKDAANAGTCFRQLGLEPRCECALEETA